MPDVIAAVTFEQVVIGAGALTATLTSVVAAIRSLALIGPDRSNRVGAALEEGMKAQDGHIAILEQTIVDLKAEVERLRARLAVVEGEAGR